MSTDLLPFAPAPSRTLDAATTLARFVARIGRSLAHRREVRTMLSMDDRMLKDIGLVRSDVVGALGEPWARDPSVLLRLRVVERRAARGPRAPRRARPVTAQATPAPCDG